MIDALTNREAGLMLAAAEVRRRAEIDAFWALCQSAPDAAAARARMAPVMADVVLLSQTLHLTADAAVLPSLAAATARMLAVEAIRTALTDEVTAALIAPFWDRGSVVAARTCAGRQVLVLRFDGPLFNPDTVPQSCLASAGGCHIICEQASDPVGGDYESLTAYGFAIVNGDGNWRETAVDLQDRSDIMRDLAACETLAQHGQLGGANFFTPPLTTFPTSSDALIAQLKAHQRALRAKGSMSAAARANMDRRTAPMRAQADKARRQLLQAEHQLHHLRLAIANAEAAALEEETGFMRGQPVRHRVTGEQGVLELVHAGQPQFRLQGTGMYVTEDIRNGEWLAGDGSPRPGPASIKA